LRGKKGTLAFLLAIPVSGPVPFRGAPLSVRVDDAQQMEALDEDNNHLGAAALCRRPTAQRTYTLDSDFTEGKREIGV
jgi:hypothetical protein